MVHTRTPGPPAVDDGKLIKSRPNLDDLDDPLTNPSSRAATPRILPNGTGDMDAVPSEHLPRGIHETEAERKHHWFVGSIDQGTTSSRFLIFNGEGDPVASHQIEFENLYPKSGYASTLPAVVPSHIS